MTSAKAQALAAAAMLLGQRCAFAQAVDAPPGHSPAYLLAQAVVALIVVVAIIYLVYFGLQRLTHRQFTGSETGPLEVIQSRHLGGDRWLYVVRIAGRTLVVGGGTGQLHPIADLGDTDVQGASPHDSDTP
jgi:flagellar biogenesis protein FliO